MATVDSNILGLMNQTVAWEGYAGTSTTYGEPNWNAPKNKTCYMEAKGLSGEAVAKVSRADDTVYDPKYQLYFDANDADVQAFTMKDRFTIRSTALGATAEIMRSRPKGMDLLVGPQGEAWIKIVTL